MFQLARSSFVYGIFGCLMLAPLNAMAQPQNGMELSVSASALNFGYKEFDDSGALLNREDGLIPGVAFSLNRYQNKWLMAADFSYHTGSVQYQGQTTTGIPANSTTHQKITDVSAHAERWITTQGGWDWAPYFGAGFHQWVRDIQPTTLASGATASGLYETYDWGLVFGGGKFTLYDSGKSHWVGDMRLTYHVMPKMKVDFRGQYDNATLPLGARLGTRLAFPWRYELDSQTSLMVEPFYERFELGRSDTVIITSNGVAAATAFEPRSISQHYGLQVGISEHF
jgi:hypothetical protein